MKVFDCGTDRAIALYTTIVTMEIVGCFMKSANKLL